MNISFRFQIFPALNVDQVFQLRSRDLDDIWLKNPSKRPRLSKHIAHKLRAFLVALFRKCEAKICRRRSSQIAGEEISDFAHRRGRFPLRPKAVNRPRVVSTDLATEYSRIVCSFPCLAISGTGLHDLHDYQDYRIL